MTISQTTQELLKAHAGRGFSDNPALTARHKIRLLQNTSKLPKHGQGAPGLFLLPDESQTCTSKLRVIFGRCLSLLRRARAGWQAWPGTLCFCRRAPRKTGLAGAWPTETRLRREARFAGVFGGLEAELDLNRTGMRVARALNSDAKARANKHGVPFLA